MTHRTMLIDGNNILSRAAFVAQGRRVEMSVDGTDTAALVIFIGMLSKYVRTFEPTHLAVMWDAGHTMRDRAYPGYKANRGTHDEDGEDTPPFRLAKEFLTWAGLPHKAVAGWEADDLIAATARQCFVGEVAIVSGDKDLLQLIQPSLDPDLGNNGRCIQYRVPDDEPWTAERYAEKYGWWPQKAAMVHALVGDPGDGVPGVPGIGPKKAAVLLEKAGWDWETLLGLLGPERAAQAVLMRSLVDLRDLDYPQEFMLANRRPPVFAPTGPEGSIAWVPLMDFCTRYQLRTVAERLREDTLWRTPQAAQHTEEILFQGMD